MARIPFVLGLALVLAAPRAHGAESSNFDRLFQGGVRRYRALDFERALAQFQLARAQPHGADDEVNLSLFEGVLQFELGQNEASGESFRSALAVNLDAQLPSWVAPRIREAFESERKRLSRRAPAPTGSTAAAPSARPQRVAGYVLDAAGAALLVGGAVCGVLTMRSYDGAKSATNQVDLDALRKRGKAEALAADVLYAAGAVTLTVGLVLTFTAPREAQRVKVGAAPLAGGAGVVVSGDF